MQEKAIENGKDQYKNLNAEHLRMKHKAGADFDDARKRAIYEENMRRNDGVLRSDKTGKQLNRPKRLKKSIKPPDNEAQIDHVYPKSKGATNDFSHAQVLERSSNPAKGDNIIFDDYDEHSIQDRRNPKELLAWLGIDAEDLYFHLPVCMEGD